MRAPDPRNPRHLIAFGFGSGFSPVAPGTAGTLVAIPLYMVMADLPLPYYLALTTLLFIVGIPLCTGVSRDLGVHDHGGIVWDEIVGYLVTMIAAPPGWPAIVLGFLFFRFFDILKPWPIRTIDRAVEGGLGIMVDDLVAGIFAAVALQLVLNLLH